MAKNCEVCGTKVGFFSGKSLDIMPDKFLGGEVRTLHFCSDKCYESWMAEATRPEKMPADPKQRKQVYLKLKELKDLEEHLVLYAEESQQDDLKQMIEGTRQELIGLGYQFPGKYKRRTDADNDQE